MVEEIETRKLIIFLNSGALVATFQLFITLGIFLANLISFGTRNLYPGSSASGSWRIVVSLQILFALVLAIGILFAPESPRWLIANGRPEEAERSLARIQGVKVEDNDPLVLADYHEILKMQELSKNDTKATWLECFAPENRTLYRTILGMSLQSLQQLTGANYFLYVSVAFFDFENRILNSIDS